MKIYGELNLKQIREENDLDFAHFTYLKGQCSCCYGPMNLPAKYWKNEVIPPRYVPGTEIYDKDGNVSGGQLTKYEYILFKNADNGSGIVKANDLIKDYTCVGWDFPINKMEKVCNMLLEQLDKSYYILMPKDESHCIIIRTYNSTYSDCNENGYIKLEYKRKK